MSLARLVGAYRLSGNTRDAERWTAEEWLRLYDAFKACDWDYTPCQWTAWQVSGALASVMVVPQWDDDGPIDNGTLHYLDCPEASCCRDSGAGCCVHCGSPMAAKVTR